jgi:SpoU rRNA Methylase family
MKLRHRVDLIGDGIENPFNIEAMIHAAEMFGSSCLFNQLPTGENVDGAAEISCVEIGQSYSPVLALENWKNVQVLYGYELQENARAALVAGNERQGISREMAAASTHAISIPMISKRLNCINVAAASAVGLYYLSYGFRGRMQIRSAPEKKRPEIVLIGGTEHAELGSAIRSAAALGWNRVFIEDRFGIWFGCDRITKSEGRAAARRGRNPIRLIPCQQDHRYLFREAVIVTTKNLGTAPPKVDLCRGPQQVVIIADENQIDVEGERWNRVAEKVTFAQIEVPATTFRYHFRHLASIALAEISRQVGQKALWKPARQEPLYESSLKLFAEETGEVIFLEDLDEY